MSSSATTAVDPAWLANARKLVGLKEIIGSKDEPKILEFFKEAGHPEVHSETTAWCAAFANAMLRRAGYAGTGSLAARSFLIWGVPLKIPKPGCIAVFKRGNSAWQGHVAFFLSDLGNYIEVLGGNQGNAVSIARMPKSELLGYRWPLISAVKPAVVVAPTKPVIVKTPPSKSATAGAAVGGAVVAGGAAAASQSGVSAIEIIAWIGGLSSVAIAAFIIGYRLIKGLWPWTGNQSQELSPLSLPASDVSLGLVQAQLALSSEVLPATPSPPPLALKQPLKRSARQSSKTRTPPQKSSSSKASVAKKSSPKLKSKSKS